MPACPGIMPVASRPGARATRPREGLTRTRPVRWAARRLRARFFGSHQAHRHRRDHARGHMPNGGSKTLVIAAQRDELLAMMRCECLAGSRRDLRELTRLRAF